MKKNKKITIKILASISVLTVVALPTAMLTSCSTSWSTNTPISIGTSGHGMSNDPFKNFRKDLIYDQQGVEMSNYLPSIYIVDPSNGKFTTNGSPVENWEYKETSSGSGKYEIDNDKTVRRNKGWYSTQTKSNEINYFLTSKQQTFGEDENSKTINTYNEENKNLLFCNNFVNYLGFSLSSILGTALRYQASQINNEKELKKAWVGTNDEVDFKHGNKEGSQIERDLNNKFYEFLFALVASNHIGKNSTTFTNVSSNFNFADDSLPIVSFNDDGTLSDQWATNLDPKYITAKTTKDIKIDAKDKKQVVTTYENIPIVITPTSLQFTYVDTTSHFGFLPEDYYKNDLNEVKKDIGNSWNNKNKFVGDGYENSPTVLKWEIQLPSNFTQKIRIPSNGQYDNRLKIQDNDSFAYQLNSFVYPLTVTTNEIIDETSTPIIQDSIEYSVSQGSASQPYPMFLLSDEDSFKENEYTKNIDGASTSYVINTDNLDKKMNNMIKAWYTNYITPSQIKEEYISNFLYYMFSSYDNGQHVIDIDSILKSY